eukprot:scaffold135147_cov65-Phaeocystis_antarctica.AAC.1
MGTAVLTHRPDGAGSANTVVPPDRCIVAPSGAAFSSSTVWLARITLPAVTCRPPPCSVAELCSRRVATIVTSEQLAAGGSCHRAAQVGLKAAASDRRVAAVCMQRAGALNVAHRAVAHIELTVLDHHRRDTERGRAALECHPLQLEQQPCAQDYCRPDDASTGAQPSPRTG